MGKKLKITNYTVSSNQNQRIVLLTDIHYYNKKMSSLLDKIYEEVSELNPDYICIAGDFIDERIIFDKEYFIKFLKNLSLISPVVISIGNHEAKSNKDCMDEFDKEFMKQIEKIDNVYLLNNNSWINNNICFTGLTLPLNAYSEKKNGYIDILKTLDEYFSKGLKKDKFNIVLSHSPYSLLYKEVKGHFFLKNVDLILSGHTHGGLTPKWICKLLKRTFITPEKHLFPRNSYGYLKNKKTIVSSGITKLSHFNPLRFLNFLFCGEIVVIELKK